MLCFGLFIPKIFSNFMAENQGDEGGRTATYDRHETGFTEAGNHLSGSHKLQRGYVN